MVVKVENEAIILLEDTYEDTSLLRLHLPRAILTRFIPVIGRVNNATNSGAVM